MAQRPASRARKKGRARRGRRTDAPPPRTPAAGPEVAAIPPARESVEDPLEDWLEEDDDRWLLEREAGDVQRSTD